MWTIDEATDFLINFRYNGLIMGSAIRVGDAWEVYPGSPSKQDESITRYHAGEGTTVDMLADVVAAVR